jgi:hypothetical protein
LQSTKSHYHPQILSVCRQLHNEAKPFLPEANTLVADTQRLSLQRLPFDNSVLEGWLQEKADEHPNRQGVEAMGSKATKMPSVRT